MSNILVVEDHPDSADVLIAALRRAQHAVDHVTDGRRALDRVTEQPPDLIVLDLRLPTFDGIAFLKVLRSYLRWNEIPVIVVSAATDAELDRLEQLGVFRIFRKAHFKLTEFTDAVAEALRPPPPSAASTLSPLM